MHLSEPNAATLREEKRASSSRAVKCTHKDTRVPFSIEYYYIGNTERKSQVLLKRIKVDQATSTTRRTRTIEDDDRQERKFHSKVERKEGEETSKIKVNAIAVNCTRCARLQRERA